MGRGEGQAGAGPDSGTHRYPLVAALGRTDLAGGGGGGGQFSTWYRMGAERSQAEVHYEWTSK